MDLHTHRRVWRVVARTSRPPEPVSVRSRGERVGDLEARPSGVSWVGPAPRVLMGTEETQRRRGGHGGQGWGCGQEPGRPEPRTGRPEGTQWAGGPVGQRTGSTRSPSQGWAPRGHPNPGPHTQLPKWPQTYPLSVQRPEPQNQVSERGPLLGLWGRLLPASCSFGAPSSPPTGTGTPGPCPLVCVLSLFAASPGSGGDGGLH